MILPRARFLAALPLLAAAMPAFGQEPAPPADAPAPPDLATPATPPDAPATPPVVADPNAPPAIPDPAAPPAIPDPAAPLAPVDPAAPAIPAEPAPDLPDLLAPTGPAAPGDSSVLPANSPAFADGANLMTVPELNAATDLTADPFFVAPAEAEAPVVPPLTPPRVSAPSGFSLAGGTPFAYNPVTSGLGELARRFSYGISASTVYDSNFLQAPVNEEDELTFTLSPFLAFRTQGTRVTVGARVALNYNAYLENSDNNGLGYNFSADATYQGGPLSANASISTSLDQGVNRYFGSNFVETSTISTSLGASYRLSAKTSLDGRFGYSWTEPDQGNLGQSDTTSFDLSAMWQATPLLRIGPGIAWSQQSGENQVDRQTLGPIVRANYQLANRISVDGTLGFDFADYGGAGGSDTSFSGSLGAVWNPSPLWGMNFTFFRGTSADGSTAGALTGAFRETTSFSLGYNRRILRSSLNLGVSYSIDDSTSPVGIAAPGSTDYFSFNASLGMPIFANRANASVFYTWSQESGNAFRDWSGHQIGCSITASF
jgi:hypothetical protein